MGKTLLKISSVLAFLLPLAPQAYAECTPLQVVIKEAVMRSPLVKSAQQNTVRSEGAVDISRSKWKPKVSLFGRSAAGDNRFGQAQIDNSGGLRLTQRLFDFGASAREREAAQYGSKEASHRLAATQESEALYIGLAYIDALEAEATRDALYTRKTFLAEKNSALTQMLEQGAATRADVAEAQAEIARAQADLSQATFAVEDAQARLKVRVGRIPQRCGLNVTRRWLLLMSPLVSEPEVLSEMAVSRDSLFAAEMARAEKLKIEEKLASRARLPVIELVGTSAYGYDQFNKDWGLRNQFGVEVNVPILTGGRLNAETRVARADAQIAHFKALETARALRQDVEVANQRIKNLGVEVTARQRARIAAFDHLEAITAEYDAGARSFSELVEIRLKYDDAALQSIQVEYDHLRQLAALASWTSGLSLGSNE